MKSYGWRYNQRGMGDVVRGSVIRWAGNASRSANCLFCTSKGAFQEAIEKRGFTVVSIESYLADGEGPYDNHWWTVTAIAPASGTVDGAGSFITAAAYEVFGDVLNPVTIDITGAPIETPAPTVTPVPLGTPPGTIPKPDPCATKENIDWLVCKLGFDDFASKFGLGVGAGAGLLAITAALVLVIAIKK